MVTERNSSDNYGHIFLAYLETPFDGNIQAKQVS